MKVRPSATTPSAPPPRTWVQLRALRALLHAAERFRDAHYPLLSEADVSFPELDIILTLGNTQGMRMKDIAGRMMASSSTSNVTRLCIALEKRGLLIRRRSPESDREVIASLTEDGDRLFKELFPKVIAFVRTYADEALPEKELETLHGLLVRLGGTPRV